MRVAFWIPDKEEVSFVDYDAWRQTVLDLADALRGLGVDAVVFLDDQFDTSAPPPLRRYERLAAFFAQAHAFDLIFDPGGDAFLRNWAFSTQTPILSRPDIAPDDSSSGAVLRMFEGFLQRHKREDHRPWGFYRVLADEPDLKVKTITVYPDKRLSLQRHQRRAEHWYVAKGSALVTRNGEEIPLEPGQAVDIPRGAWHRMRNPGDTPLVFVEVQTGDYFGEDDIERSEDDYGRA